MYQAQDPVLDELRERGADPVGLARAAAEAELSQRPLRDVLLSSQLVSEVELAEAIAAIYLLKTIDLNGYPIDPAAAAKIPLPMAKRHGLLGVAINGDEIIVALSDPGDVVALDDVRAATGMVVSPVVAARDELNKAIDRLRRDDNDLGDVAASLTHEAQAASSHLETGNEDAPIVRYVNNLIEQAITSRASDLHLEPTEDDLRVRFRIDGVLHEVDTVPKAVQSALISRLKIMSNVDIAERRIPQNGRITVTLGQHSIDLRTATLPTVWGEKIVLRVLDTGSIDLDLKKLGFSENNYGRFSASFQKPHGMLLVTGPTGSGKSTTLYATLTEISSPEVNIITVEDPVEYRLHGVNQVQVNTKAGLTFAAVLPAILRSDPDVVLIGEIRDRTTAQLAIEAALTGHLVLSTLHTNDAPSAITRLVEMGIEPFLVGSSIDAVMAQRLSRKLCERCKESYVPTSSELKVARWPYEIMEPPRVLWRPVGCRSCANTGYRGRIALHEVMPVTEEIERLAVERASAHEIQRTALLEGMQLLRTDGLVKASAGQTSIQEVLRVAV